MQVAPTKDLVTEDDTNKGLKTRWHREVPVMRQPMAGKLKLRDGFLGLIGKLRS